MQFTTKLFDIAPQGLGASSTIQKIAVKMPTEGLLGVRGGETQFAEIMASLLCVPADQIETALDKLETLEMGDSSTQAVPLLDLSKMFGGQEALAAMLDGDAEAETAAGSLVSGGDLSGADLSEMIAGLVGRQGGQKAGGASEETSYSKGASDSAIQRIAIENVAEKMSQGEAGNGGTSKETETGAKNSGFLNNFHAGQGSGKPVADEPPPAAVKSPAAALFQKKSMGGGKAEGEADSGSLTEKGAESDAVFDARAAVRSGHPHQSARQTVTTDQDGSRAAFQEGQNGMGEKTVLRDSDLKERIQPNDSQKEAAPFTNVGQTASSTPSNAASVDSHLNHTAPSQEMANGNKMTVQPQQETPESAASSKEMASDVVRQIVQRMSLRTDGRQSQMQIRLKPEFLGNLRMDVITENRLVMVRMTAESQSVKEMIEKNIGLLKTELQQHGLQIQKVDVTVAQNNQNWAGGQQQQTNFDQARHQNGRRQGNRNTHQRVPGEGGEAVEQVSTVDASRKRSSEVDFFA